MPNSREVQTDTTAGPQTCCSTCRTVFQVAAELLHSSNTRVRCGECYAIFDALANLVDAQAALADHGTRVRSLAGGGGRDVDRSAGAASLAGLANDTAALDVTYSNFDLFSEDAELPEVAYLDQTRDTPEFDFDSVEPDEDQSFSDTLFVADMTMDASRRLPVLDADDPRVEHRIPSSESPRGVPAPGEHLPDVMQLPLDSDATSRIELDFHYQDPEPDPEPNPDPGGTPKPDESVPAMTQPMPGGVPDVGTAAVLLDASLAFEPARERASWRLPIVAVSALLVLLAGLHGYREREALHEDPLTRPVYEAVCLVTGCEVPMRRALDRIELLERQMFTHPTLPDALVIDVAFRNAAVFSQALPALSVRLSDPSGRLVARRTFQPNEYLADTDEAFVLEPGSRLRVSLDVDDPGRDASSFVIDFVAANADR